MKTTAEKLEIILAYLLDQPTAIGDDRRRILEKLANDPELPDLLEQVEDMLSQRDDPEWLMAISAASEGVITPEINDFLENREVLTQVDPDLVTRFDTLRTPPPDEDMALWPTFPTFAEYLQSQDTNVPARSRQQNKDIWLRIKTRVKRAWNEVANSLGRVLKSTVIKSPAWGGIAVLTLVLLFAGIITIYLSFFSSGSSVSEIPSNSTPIAEVIEIPTSTPTGVPTMKFTTIPFPHTPTNTATAPKNVTTLPVTSTVSPVLISPTNKPTATSSPTMIVTLEPAVVLITPDDSKIQDTSSVLLEWEWFRELQTNEFFQVEIRYSLYNSVVDENILPSEVGWVKDKYYRLTAYNGWSSDLQQFAWSVSVVHGVPERERPGSTPKYRVWIPGTQSDQISQFSAMRTVFLPNPPSTPPASAPDRSNKRIY